MSDRLENTSRNIFYKYLYQISYMAIGFVSRMVFVSYLDQAYLGVNGLFTNILSVLAVSELGLGSAIGYALYKPLAENDQEKIKSIMALFRKAYRIIGTFITVAGVALIPFLPYLINNTTGLPHIEVYYVLYLFNSVSSYFLTYRNILLTSDQKEYKITRIEMVGSFTLALVQMVALIVTKNYFVYLLCDVVLRFGMQLIIRRTVKKTYRYLDEPAQKLTKEDTAPIVKNIKALLVHKVGEISVNQTDNIIISAFISLTMSGIVSNYTMFTNYAMTFISATLTAAVPSVGNLIVSESDTARMTFYKTYRLLSYWLHGWVALGFWFLASPLIEVLPWLGTKWLLSPVAVFFMAAVIMVKGEGTAMYNYKVAAGLYDPDKYVALIGGGINLVVSIVAAKLMGVAGVYLGTLVYIIFSVILRCWIIYRRAFARPAELIPGMVRYAAFLVLSALGCGFVCSLLPNTWLGFGIKFLTLVLLPNAVFLLLNWRQEELHYYLNLIRGILKKLPHQRG
ncbi:MAG: oligosaccharide flippase family protein [Faecalibacterium sp.]|nr:oligosaccharide flippase family protein [Faecalibacterium sp.]